MITAYFLSGALLCALLIMDICCLPVQQDSTPSMVGSYRSAPPEYNSYWETPSGQFEHSDISWALPSVSYEEMETDYVDLPPAGPAYEAGELARFEERFEKGRAQAATEERGYLNTLTPAGTGHGFVALPQPEDSGSGHRGVYPYVDNVLVRGKLPYGTLTDFSSVYREGSEHWHDSRFPKGSAPIDSAETFDYATPWHVKPGDLWEARR